MSHSIKKATHWFSIVNKNFFIIPWQSVIIFHNESVHHLRLLSSSNVVVCCENNLFFWLPIYWHIQSNWPLNWKFVRPAIILSPDGLSCESVWYSYYSKEPKRVTSFNNSHPFMQTLTNQKLRTVSSWLLIGLNLHERMWVNQKRSHFCALCCNYDCLQCTFLETWKLMHSRHLWRRGGQ